MSAINNACNLPRRLYSLGYLPGAPAHVSPDAILIDTEVAAESRCEGCGASGLELSAWHQGRSYRAVARCPECGWDTEF